MQYSSFVLSNSEWKMINSLNQQATVLLKQKCWPSSKQGCTADSGSISCLLVCSDTSLQNYFLSSLYCCKGLLQHRCMTLHAELHEVSISPFLQAVEVPPYSSSTCSILRALHPSNLYLLWFAKLLRMHSVSWIINKDTKQHWSPVSTLRNIISNQPPVRLHTTGHNPLSLTIQPNFHPPYWTFFQSISHWFVCQVTMRDYFKGLAKVIQYPLLSTFSPVSAGSQIS